MELIFSQVVLSHWPPCDTFSTLVSTCPYSMDIRTAQSSLCFQCLPVCCNTYTPIWTRVPHLLQTHCVQGGQPLALILLFILEEQTKKRARFSDREPRHFHCLSMTRDWHEYDPRRNRTKNGLLVQASDGHYRDKEERNFDSLPALPRILWHYDLGLRHRKTCDADNMNDGI